MTADNLKAARFKCGLTQADFALALGYRSERRKNLADQVDGMESGRRPISPQVARLAFMFERFGIPEELRAEPRPAPGPQELP